MTGFARQQIRETARYIHMSFGKKYSDNFMRKVRQTKQLLAENLNLGPIEPLLTHLPTTYRSIVVNHLTKMVYRILDDHIEIVDFWDVRREPDKLVEQVK